MPGALWKYPVCSKCLIHNEDSDEDPVINRLSLKEPVELFHDFFRSVDNLR